MRLPLDEMRRTFPESASSGGGRFTTKGGKARVCVASPVPFALTLCGEDEHTDPAETGDAIDCPDCLKIINLCKRAR